MNRFEIYAAPSVCVCVRRGEGALVPLYVCVLEGVCLRVFVEGVGLVKAVFFFFYFGFGCVVFFLFPVCFVDAVCILVLLFFFIFLHRAFKCFLALMFGKYPFSGFLLSLTTLMLSRFRVQELVIIFIVCIHFTDKLCSSVTLPHHSLFL